MRRLRGKADKINRANRASRADRTDTRKFFQPIHNHQ